MGWNIIASSTLKSEFKGLMHNNMSSIIPKTRQSPLIRRQNAFLQQLVTVCRDNVWFEYNGLFPCMQLDIKLLSNISVPHCLCAIHFWMFPHVKEKFIHFTHHYVSAYTRKHNKQRLLEAWAEWASENASSIAVLSSVSALFRTSDSRIGAPVIVPM